MGEIMQVFTEETATPDEEIVHTSSSLLDSKTSQLDDILNEKLELAFHKQTSTVVLHDVAKIASEHSPIDLAYAACRLPPVDRPILYENLSDLSSKIDFMMNTDSSTRVAIFRHISDEEVKKLIEKMPPDEAVKVLEDISERRFRRVLEILDATKALRIKEINKHQRNTAGRLMTNEFFAFSMDTTIGEVASKIRDNPGIGLTTKIFVVNGFGELQGYVPARNLIINPSHLPLKQVMRALTHKVSPETSREEVVDLVERYKIAALPVVDEDDKPLGVITYEDVIEAIEDISDETIANMAGTTEKISEQESLIKRFFSRAPWIFVTLCAGLINVGVMSSFQMYAGGALTFVLFFVPLITGMSGNIGIQCSTVLVRSMALGLISKGNKGEAILKELLIGMSTGLVFGVICGILVFALDFVGVSALSISPAAVGIIVGVGLMGACIAGTILGVFSPLFFTRCGIDPAVASGPIVTAFNDFLSMSIYFLIAIGLGCILL
jgi:magnesium transporter